jgi:hypothetical protein
MFKNRRPHKNGVAAAPFPERGSVSRRNVPGSKRTVFSQMYGMAKFLQVADLRSVASLIYRGHQRRTATTGA